MKNRHSTEDLFLNVAQNVMPVKAIHVFQIGIIVFSSLNDLALTNIAFERVNQYTARRAGILELIIQIQIKLFVCH